MRPPTLVDRYSPAIFRYRAWGAVLVMLAGMLSVPLAYVADAIFFAIPLTLGLALVLGLVALAPATSIAADEQPLLPISPPKLLSVYSAVKFVH